MNLSENLNIKEIYNISHIICYDSFNTVINDKFIQFYKIKKELGKTSIYYIDSNKQYFMKIPIYYNEYDILKREIYILKILSKYDKHFQKIVYYNNFLIITEYIDDIIKKETIPNDIFLQINNIDNILKKENIIHCDIKLEEMLIKNNILYIVDFGWAKLNGNWHCDINLCNYNKPNFDETPDLDCMINIIYKLLD